MNHKGYPRCVWLIASFILVSCGGGGSDSDEPAQRSIIFVNAGADFSVNENATITLSGEARSETEGLTYSWRASPSLEITQSDPSSPDATATAPSTTETLLYSFTLTVIGDNSARGEDTLDVTVVPVNEPPVAVIDVPVFNNISALSLPAATNIQLDGSGSSDSDAADVNRQIVTWQWQQTAGTDVIGNNPSDLPQLTIVTPETQSGETLQFDLTVTDSEGATNTASVLLNVLAISDTPPTASAGLDQFLFSGESIVLAGVASSPVSAALPLVVSWQSSLPVSINQPDAASTFGIAPLVETQTDVTMQLFVTDAFGNQVTDELTVQVRPVPVPVISDTGVVLQGTNDTVVVTHQNAFPGQDGQLGQDRMALSNTLEKSGRGRSGFDYTPLNTNGDEMDDLSEPWRCVRDNTTGLVWEIKTDDTQLHGAQHSYSWFQTDDNGGFEGVENGASTACSIAQCNTSAYVTAVNTAGLCGFFDWRLPSHDELMSILDFGATDGASIDTQYFPNAGGTDGNANWYWSNQPGADGVADDSAQNAWAIDFNSGVDNFLNKGTASSVRLVRAGR